MVKNQESLVDVLRREVAALNRQLQECDAIFRWHVDDKHMSVDIIPANDSWLGASPCINISAAYRNYVKHAFLQSGYIIHFKEPGGNSRLLVAEMKAGNSTMCI